MLTISVVELESPTRRKRKRWTDLNSILDKNKKAKTTLTNYLQWSFFKSHENYIEQEDTTLRIESSRPTKEGLKMIAGKIYSLLSDG
jgi:hypothetical protein